MSLGKTIKNLFSKKAPSVQEKSPQKTLPKRIYKLKEVFTPGTVARFNYIPRRGIEEKFCKYLSLPGIQIVLYGHSGCGKTTLTMKNLDSLGIRYITSSCHGETRIKDILYDAFDQLNTYCIKEKKVSERTKDVIKGKIKTPIAEMGTEMTNEEGSEETADRALQMQLTPQRLSEQLGENECVWVIEDFHKVAPSEKKKLSDVIKIFVNASNRYPDTKIICIGAVATARELVQPEGDIKNRIAEIEVPLMKESEIKEIVKNGSEMMNIEINNVLVEKIQYHSNKLAILCHQICYDICHAKKVNKTADEKILINGEDFELAIKSIYEQHSDTYTKIYEKAMTLESGKRILFELAKSEKEFLNMEEIGLALGRKDRKYLERIENSLTQMTSTEYDELLRYDANSKKYYFNNPFVKAFVRSRIRHEEYEKKQKNKEGYQFLSVDQFEDIILSTNVIGELFYKASSDVLDEYLQETHGKKTGKGNKYWEKNSDIKKIKQPIRQRKD